MFTHQPQDHASISLGGRIYRLCPTFEDLSQIEKKLSTSLLSLAKKLSEGIISLEELAVILEHSVEAEARTLDLKLGILETGIVHVTERLTSLFIHLFKGAEVPAKEAAPENPPTVPAGNSEQAP